MGEALVKGLQSSSHAKNYGFEATTRSKESALEASRKLGIECHTDNAKLAASCKVLVLCVKPHHARAVLEEIAPKITRDHLIITIAASLTTAQVAEWSGGKAAVVRAMPNTPCLIGEGMTVYCEGSGVKPEHLKLTDAIFSTVGRAVALEESLMDGVTGLSGCGPAYIYLVIEALSEAGVKVGLPRKTATLLAAQTLVGASKMVLERGEHPAALKDEVTTPAGCTIDGLMALEEGKLRVTLIKAVLAATKRSRSLSKA
ncbi:MAG: pyrroline-5-carboxylate reductase [Deltaproteobacteria bacterium]|nr:pyrroline-5-carboxylate reductase [Deltaproteobacteria bacterium]